MASVSEFVKPVKPLKAFYAHMFMSSGVLTKLNGTLYFVADEGEITEVEPGMVNFLTVLGECGVADTQKVMDTLHGGAAWIATHRAMEVA